MIKFGTKSKGRLYRHHRCSECKQIFEMNYRAGDPLPKHFPFCSQRCKNVDLLKWFTEENRDINP